MNFKQFSSVKAVSDLQCSSVLTPSRGCKRPWPLVVKLMLSIWGLQWGFKRVNKDQMMLKCLHVLKICKTVKTIFWWHKFLAFHRAIDTLLKWCLIQFCNVSDCHSSVNNPEVAWDSQIYNPKHFMNNLLIRATMHGNDIWLVIAVLCV